MYFNPPEADEPFRFGLTITNEQGKARVEIDVTIHVNGTLVSGKNVTIEGVAKHNPPDPPDITRIEIRFSPIFCYPPQIVEPGLLKNNCSLFLNRVPNTNYFRGGGTSLYWEHAGDFGIDVYLHHSDGRIEISGFSDKIIHVEPQTRLDDERTSKINLALAFAVTFLAFIEAITLIGKMINHTRGQSDESSESKSEGSNATPPKKSTKPTRRNRKTESEPPNNKP